MNKLFLPLITAIVLISTSAVANGLSSKISSLFASKPTFGIVRCIGLTPDQCAKETGLSLQEERVKNRINTCNSTEGTCQIFFNDTRRACSSEDRTINVHNGVVIGAMMNYYAVDRCRQYDPSISTVEELIGSSAKPDYVFEPEQNRTSYGATFTAIWQGDLIVRLDANCIPLRLPSGKIEFGPFRKCQVIRYIATPCDKGCQEKKLHADRPKLSY